jgi:hypothetical protein
MQEHMLLNTRHSFIQNIIRRNNCVYATLGTCYSVWMTGMQEHMLLNTRQSSIQNIIRRNNSVYATLGTWYSVWMTVWYAGAYAAAYQTVIHTE